MDEKQKPDGSSSPRRRKEAAASVRSPSRSRSASSSCCFSQSPWSRGRPSRPAHVIDMNRDGSRWQTIRKRRHDKGRRRKRFAPRPDARCGGGVDLRFRRGADGRRLLRRRALLQLVLPRHRLQRHHPGRNLGPVGCAAGAQDHGALRCQCRPGLPWKFEPEQNEIEVRIGEVVTVFYTVTNQAARDHRRRWPPTTSRR